jgi:hypothetical protein
MYKTELFLTHINSKTFSSLVQTILNLRIRIFLRFRFNSCVWSCKSALMEFDTVLISMYYFTTRSIAYIWITIYKYLGLQSVMIVSENVTLIL